MDAAGDGDAARPRAPVVRVNRSPDDILIKITPPGDGLGCHMAITASAASMMCLLTKQMFWRVRNFSKKLWVDLLVPGSEPGRRHWARSTASTGPSGSC